MTRERSWQRTNINPWSSHMSSVIDSDRLMELSELAQSRDRFDIPFTMAFQPIVDLDRMRVFSYEALARGTDNESAAKVFARLGEANEYAFDHSCRARAIQL